MCSRPSRSAAPISPLGAAASPSPSAGRCRKSIIPDIAKIPGVAGVTGQLLTFAATDNDDHVIAFGWPEDSFFWSSVPLAEGRLPNPGERKFALVGKDIAHTLGKHIGDDITLLGDKFHLIGITNYSSVINRNAVIAGLRRPPASDVPHRIGDLHRGEDWPIPQTRRRAIASPRR